MEIICGIYKIINKKTGAFYIGSSKTILFRWERHKSNLKSNRHHNIRLLRAWRKYGEENFEFRIEETVNSPSDLLEVEQRYLDAAAKIKRDLVYNLSFIAGKVEMTPEVRRKISLSNLGKIGLCGKDNPMFGEKMPDHVKEKIRFSLMGAKNHNFGKILTVEHKLKISKSRSGKNNQNYDYEIYNFSNEKTGDFFSGTRHEFYKKYELDARSVRKFIRGKFATIAGWKLVK